MFLHRLVHGCAFIALAASFLAAAPGAQGVLEGRLKIFSLSDVNLADDAHETSAAEQPYSEYPLIVRNGDGRREIARVTPDKGGNYRLALPPGDYILDIEGRAPGHVRAKPKAFTVIANHTVRVDMEIDTGIR